ADVVKDMKVIEDALVPHLKGGERDDFKFEVNRVPIIKKHVPQHVSQETLQKYLGLRKEKTRLEKTAPTGTAQALWLTESGSTPREPVVLGRGNRQAKGDKAGPGFPSVSPAETPRLTGPAPGAQTSGRRKVLADWIASPKNPLTARVWVNRVWQYHFGRGIVRSANDFGYRGSAPTHPELLDWLAGELVERGWKLKDLHQLMVLPTTSGMSWWARREPDAPARDGSRAPDPAVKDPENDLYWRFDLRRLSAEELRDSILAVSGNINLAKMGGPSIYPEVPKEVLAGQSMPGAGWGKSTPQEQARRSVYIHIKRSLIVPLLSVFDAADPDSTCPVRFTTTQPAQALTMLNSKFMHEQAAVFAKTAQTAGTDPAAQVRLVLQRTQQREPLAREIERGVR